MNKQQTITHTQKRFDELVQFLKTKPGVRAIFIHGSIARGEIDEWSDIDVLVVTLRKTSFIRYVDGRLDMEVDAVCLDQVEERLRREPAICYAWSNLQAVYDPENLGATISATVKQCVREYETPKLFLADTYIRLRHLRQKCARGTFDTVVQSALTFTVAQELIAAEFGLRNRILPPAMIIVPMYFQQTFSSPAMKTIIRSAVKGTKRSQLFVSTIDHMLARLAPVMRNFPQYYRNWNNR